VVGPTNELWKIDIQGNYAEKLKALGAEIQGIRSGFNNLKASMVAAGAEFKKPAEEIKGLSGAAKTSFQNAQRVRAEFVQLATNAQVLGRAYSSIAKETNKLNTQRTVELQILEQTKQKQDPLLIQLRAEAAAIRRVTTALQKQVEEKRFAQLAAEAGLKVEEKSVKVFNAEADALDKITKAAQKAAVAKELQSRGFDASGNISSVVEGPAIPDSFNGALTAEGRAKAADAANSRLAKLEADNLTKSKLLQNQAYLDGVKRSKELQKQMDELTATTEKTESATNKFLFTFRRLIGVMALFTVARVVTREFNNMVSGAIRFQAEIEATRVGLAGLIAASGKIQSPIGENVGIDQQLLLSQQIAIDQMNKLRTDALATAASYNELAAAFQNAVAPGIQSGLTLDQIRKVTVNISQAATGLGLAQDQLAEEIRSLFTGAISARNTRIATALGITPADINRAKELGNLFEFLDKRFAAISKTGKLLMSTFTGQLSNAADAFKQLLATSSTPLFEQLKKGLADVQGAIFTTVKQDIVLDPKTLSAFRELFQGLAQGVAAVRAAFSRLDLSGAALAFGTLGQVLGTAAAAVANALVLFANAASPTLAVFKALFSIINTLLAVVNQLPSPIKDAVGFLTSWVTKTAFALVVVRKLGVVWAAVGGLSKKVRDYMAAQLALSTAMQTPLTGVSKVINLIVTRLKLVSVWVIAIVGALAGLDAILKANGAQKGVFDFINEGVDSLTDKLFRATDAARGLKEELAGQAQTPLGITVNDFRQLQGEFQAISLDLQKGIRAGAAELRNTVKNLGLGSAVANQLAEVDNLRADFLQQDASVRAEVELQALKKRLTELSQQVDLTTADAAKATIKKAENQLESSISRIFEIQSRFARSRGLEDRTPESNRQLESLAADNALDTSSNTRRVVEEFKVLNKELESSQLNLSFLKKEFAKKFAPAFAIKDQIESLQDIKAQAEAALAIRQAQTILRNSISESFNVDRQNTLSQFDLASVQAAADLATGSDVLRAEAAQKAASAYKLAAENGFNLIASFGEIAGLRQQLTELLDRNEKIRKSGVDIADEELVTMRQAELQLFKQIQLRKKAVVQQQALNEEQQREAFNVAKLADLRANGSFTQGLGKGLLDFKAQNSSLFDVGSQFATGALTSFSQLGGTAIASLFDPNTNFELQEAAGQLALQLGTDLVTQMIQNLLASLIPSSLASSLGFQTAATGLTAAGSALKVAAAAWTPVILGLRAVAAQLKAAAAIKAGASVVAAGSAVGGKVTSSSPRFRGPASAFAGAKGFARGGFAGKDARDTIPAWLRPNEWVIRPEAVAYYGDRLFHLLNTRRLDAGALSGIAGTARGVSPSIRAVSKVGYATGGKVASSAARGGVQTVVVANYYDEQTMDRSLAAGGNAQLRFTRTKRAQYLASLGLSPGG
jgi:hypothetical protein